MSFQTYEEAIEAADEHYKAILKHPAFVDEYMPVFERLKQLGWPETIDIAAVVDTSNIQVRRGANSHMAAFGYKIYPCPTTKDGRWKRVRLYSRSWACDDSKNNGNFGN